MSTNNPKQLTSVWYLWLGPIEWEWEWMMYSAEVAINWVKALVQIECMKVLGKWWLFWWTWLLGLEWLYQYRHIIESNSTLIWLSIIAGLVASIPFIIRFQYKQIIDDIIAEHRLRIIPWEEKIFDQQVLDIKNGFLYKIVTTLR
jgi:hypothetical protein